MLRRGAPAAGVEKIQSAHYLTTNASELVSVRNSQLAEASCPASQTTIWAGAVASATDAADLTGTTPGPSPVTDFADMTTAPAETQTDLTPVKTSAPSAAGRQEIDSIAVLLVGLIITMLVGLAL